MTVQTLIHDGVSIKTRTWRKVYQTKGLAEVREGFYGQREHSRFGILVQLKGKERIILNTFGKLENGETVTSGIAKRIVLTREGI